jgi:hypothetical protein
MIVKMTNWALRLRVRAGKGGLAAGLRLARAQASGSHVPVWTQTGVSILLFGPLIFALAAASLLSAFGVNGPHNVLAAMEEGGVRTAVLHALVWLGPALAVALNILWMTQVRVARPAGGISADITLRLGVVRGLVLAVVLFLAVAFYGHLVADAIACSNGVGSAC